MPNKQLDPAEIATIAASATTPLKPDDSERKIWTWHDARAELPPKDNSTESIEVLLFTMSGDYIIGRYWLTLDAWQTDLGELPKPIVTHWCMLPEKPV